MKNSLTGRQLKQKQNKGDRFVSLKLFSDQLHIKVLTGGFFPLVLAR